MVCVQVRFVIMGNVFPTETQLHRRFDLKGSTLGRTAGARVNEPNTTLKVRVVENSTQQNM